MAVNATSISQRHQEPIIAIAERSRLGAHLTGAVYCLLLHNQKGGGGASDLREARRWLQRAIKVKPELHVPGGSFEPFPYAIAMRFELSDPLEQALTLILGKSPRWSDLSAAVDLIGDGIQQLQEGEHGE